MYSSGARDQPGAPGQPGSRQPGSRQPGSRQPGRPVVWQHRAWVVLLPGAPRKGVLMRVVLLVAIGALLTVAGLVWMLQGLGYIGGSVMTGVTLWAVVGPLVAIIGLFMAAFGLRTRYRRSRP